MKLNPIKLMAALAISAAGIFTVSCSDNDSAPHPGSIVTGTFNVVHPHLKFNTAGIWEKAAEPSTGDKLSINDADYSRYVNMARGTLYGFQPCQATDTVVTDLTANGLEYGPYFIGSTPAIRTTYMNACWDKSESLTSAPLLPSCRISLSEASEFLPSQVVICNNAVTYAAMKQGKDMQGNAWNGELNLLIYGVYKGKRSEPVKVTLGTHNGSNFSGINVWKSVNLESLGYVNYIYFQMEATGGMTDMPAYFCVRQFTASYMLR